MRPTFTRRCQLIPSYCSDLFPSPFVVFSPPIIALPSSYQEIDDGLRQPPEKITHSFNEEVKAHPRRRTSLMTSLVFKKKNLSFLIGCCNNVFFLSLFLLPFSFLSSFLCPGSSKSVVGGANTCTKKNKNQKHVYISLLVDSKSFSR